MIMPKLRDRRVGAQTEGTVEQVRWRTPTWQWRLPLSSFKELMSYLFNAEWLPLSLMAFHALMASIVLLIIGLAAWIVGYAWSNRSH
ncbi:MULTISPECIES: hypothetical protein [unclassified Mesorhizobium]|uniref:hypothetical protein n=1 Tax=unclassified Mesorhizobium TaxID=325217 RepID=UPI000BD962AE|nr:MULTISPECIES: hypothetical protein [unclassified Mesorhizobium]PBB83998.1 hypothetical protein CK216_26125 [Mesorhizobium sp. WSM3876]RWE21186.1 MAG: hypothetical protein EOS41_27070 [Mesorhizobium sp.]